MNLTINGQAFTARLADSKAAAELRDLLPLALTMQDHLGNEKHADLPRRLSSADSAVRRIEAGDILLWQGNTLVIFYESFDTPYRYTRLGKIESAANLKAVVGAGSVSVKFEP